MSNAADAIVITVHRINGKVVSGTPIVEAPAEVKAEALSFAPSAEPVDTTAAPKAGTKLAQAMDIYRALTDRSRKAVIQAFVTQLAMSPAGASTYQNTCKKAIDPIAALA